MKKNNKGFSLVELIVVVLIMGILAVALAPQVMKWVGTASENQRKSGAQSIKSVVQIAVAESQYNGVTSFNWTSSGVAGISPSSLKTAIEDASGKDYSLTGYHVTISGTTVDVN